MFGTFLYDNYFNLHPLKLIFPFENNDYRAYDITEFMIYVITPSLVFFLYQYVTNKKGS